MSETKAVRSWIESHNRDYGAARERLELCRNTILNGRISDASDMLKASYINAVMSIQTAKDRHESAFVAYHSGNKELKQACLDTVYGGQKHGWLSDTFGRVNFDNVVIAVRHHVRNNTFGELLDVLTDKIKGVSYRKCSFMLSMVGIYEYMCIDSNVGRFADIGDRNNFSNGSDYLDTCYEIYHSIIEKSPFGRLFPPFLVQWAIYDYERGEHARHMVFYNEVLNE